LFIVIAHVLHACATEHLSGGWYFTAKLAQKPFDNSMCALFIAEY